MALSLLGCDSKQETAANQDTTDSIDGAPKAIPVLAPVKDYPEIELHNPDFRIRNNPLNDGTLYESPDKKVKFYVWTSAEKLRPNDVIFPNEKITSQRTKEKGFIKTSWTLQPNKHIPFFRKYDEFKLEDKTYITGFFYADDKSYTTYLLEYKKFTESILLSIKE